MTELNLSRGGVLFVNVTPLVLVLFTIAALATPKSVYGPSTHTSIPLVVIFLTSAVALQLSGWISLRIRSRLTKNEYNEAAEDDEDVDDESKEEHDNRSKISPMEFYNILDGVMKPSLLTIRVFFAVSLILILTLMIRLFAVNNFGGNPSQLDYGPKISKEGYAGPTNIAFEELDFDTFAHAIQGFLAALLSYPSVGGFISKMVAVFRGSVVEKEDGTDRKCLVLLVKPSVFALSFIELLRVCMTIYPFYSIVKRLRYTSFAQTSHANNTTEWCLGCILGVAIGCLVTALIQRHLVLVTKKTQKRNSFAKAFEVREVESDGIVMKKYGFGKSSDFVIRSPSLLKVVEILSICILILFAVTTFLTGLFFGLSWNYGEDDKVSAGMVATFVCLNVIIYMLFFFLSK